jgi:hypothetical protein
MWKTVAPLLTGSCLFLAVPALANVPVRAADDKQPKSSFAGLINDKSVDKLVKPTNKRVNGSTYALSILSDAKAWKAFTDAAGLKQPPFDVNWDKQAVVVVVLKEHTYRLHVKEWTAKDNIGELVFYWDGIQPDYSDRFPALMYRFDKEGLKKVVVKGDLDYLKIDPDKKAAEKVLGEIPCP